jgi:hypothetical protein
MARLFGIMNEGSLLRRTLVWVGTFAVGSVAVVGLASFLLVTIAKAVLPSPAAAADQAKEAKDKEGEAEVAEDAPAPAGKSPLLKSRPVKRVRGLPTPPPTDDGANE